MMIEDYDRPPSHRAPVTRSASSNSLKEQLSPDLTSDIKVYRKMSPAVPRRRRRSYGVVAVTTKK